MPVFFPTVEDEYKKLINLRKEDVNAIFDWMAKQPHLPKISEFQIILFLHSCFYKLEPTKTCIENYYTIKTHHPEIFANRQMSLIKKSSDVLIVSVLPKMTPEGYYVLFGKLLNTNSDKFDFIPMCMQVVMVGVLGLAQFGTSEGQIVVIDTAGMSLGHVTKFNLSLCRALLFYLQQAMPVRLKAVHIINPHPVVDTCYGMLKPFLQKELIELIHMHSSINEFYKCVPQDIMPNEYGGSIGTLNDLKESTMQNLQDNVAFFNDEEKLVVDEKKRRTPSKYLQEMVPAGTAGSFKKLDID